MDDKVDAIIRVKVPKWQIGEEASVYFPDTMTTRGKCEAIPKYILKVKNLTAEDKKHFQECWNKSAGGLFVIPDNYEIVPIERQQGEWIFNGFCFSSTQYKCNKCEYPTLEKTNFCPNCGIRMKKGD